MKLFFSLVCFLGVVAPTSVMAVTDETTFRLIVGDDVTSPTIPALESVIPVAPTQIDVDWTAAVDNWIFGGYVLLRDGVPIATTSLTSFSDTGLTEETLYEYAVYAFDAAGNISSTSASVATTTPAVPPITPTPTTGGNTGTQSTLVLRLGDFSLTPGRNDATVAWTTTIVTRFTLRWGRTDAYIGGYITNESYQTSHVTTITDLEPGTVYQYELIGYTPTNRPLVLKRGEFATTPQGSGGIQVQNVETLTAKVVGTDVELSYTIPEGEAGARVRVVRSHLGFPGDFFDGALVYEGDSEEVYDSAALARFAREYYTVFLIREDGSVSSGAVVVAEREGVSTGEPSDLPAVIVPSSQPKTTSTVPVQGSGQREILLKKFASSSIVIVQNEHMFSFADESVRLSSQDPFTLSIAKNTLPNHLKSIVVTLLDPTNQRRSYSFLLRLNQLGTAYEAVVAPLSIAGASELTVDIYDFEQRVVGQYSVHIDFVVTDAGTPPVVFPDGIVSSGKRVLPFAVPLVLIVFGGSLFFWYRSRATEDKQ
jgi:hypothetical protein